MGYVNPNSVVKAEAGQSMDNLVSSTIADDGTSVYVGAPCLNSPGDVRLRALTGQALAYLQARDGNSNADIGLRLRTQQAGPSGPGVIEAVTIDKYGNVDVGSDSPISNFQVDQPTTGPGTVSIYGAFAPYTVNGVGTQFQNTFKVGDTITVQGQTARIITGIPSNETLFVSSPYVVPDPPGFLAGLTYTLVGGTRFAAKGNGNCGLGTAQPQGLLQLADSYIVAPAPVNDETDNDYWNIMHAITEVGGRGKVYLQEGTYRLKQTLLFDAGYSYLNLIGKGTGATKIILNTTDENYQSVIEISGTKFVSIKNLSIDTAQSTTAGRYGIKISGGQSGHNTVENVLIDDVHNYFFKGILLTGGTSNNIFRNIRVVHCKTGVQLGEDDAPQQHRNWANGNHFYSGMVNDCTACGVRFYNGWSNTLYGLNIVGNADLGGVSFEGHDNTYQDGNSIIGCYMESNNPADVRIVSNSNKIMNCFLGSPTPIEWGLSDQEVYFGNVAFGNRIFQVNDEENLYLGDSFQQIKAKSGSGLIFQTYWYLDDVNAFRWKGKEHGGTVHDLMTLMAYTGRLGIGETDPKAKLHSTGSTIVGAATSEVSDANMGNGQLNFYVDQTNNRLYFKVKYSTGGTPKKGYISLA